MADDDKIVKLVQPDGLGEGVSLSPDKVLEAAVGQMQTAIVIGTAADGSLYVASSEGAADTFAMLALASRWMIRETARLRGWD